jgi:hypothetical protein
VQHCTLLLTQQRVSRRQPKRHEHGDRDHPSWVPCVQLPQPVKGLGDLGCDPGVERERERERESAKVRHTRARERGACSEEGCACDHAFPWYPQCRPRERTRTEQTRIDTIVYILDILVCSIVDYTRQDRSYTINRGVRTRTSVNTGVRRSLPRRAAPWLSAPHHNDNVVERQSTQCCLANTIEQYVVVRGRPPCP